MSITKKRSLLAGILTTALMLGFGAVLAPPAYADPVDEQYRPYLHYTPESNWMNDPNGLVYHKGVYHLFYQYNPFGNGWGNMSWGHATSSDLLHWTEQPLAIAQGLNGGGTSIEDIFSGSIVVDTENTSGLGTAENPPLVAIYTSAYTGAHPSLAGRQAQSLAYSVDDGATWTKYAGNPVVDRNSANFRDPKVFWYSGDAGDYWVMAAVEATQYKVVLYKSEDLKNWQHLSDFGPANSVGGIWECPDLFPLAVDGDPDNVKWVMVVNLNPGAVAGGSGGQYFVGEFDGVTFTSESTASTGDLPEGTLMNGFDDGTYGGWTVNNEPGNWANGPWGSAPATGALPGQSAVTGFVGNGLVNSFLDVDWPKGTIESPEFTIDSDYVNFLVGGGNHPHTPGSQTGNEPPDGTLLFEGFEFASGNLADAGWTLSGDFEAARNPSTVGGEYFIGNKRINTFEGGPKGDDNVGNLTSPEFVIDDSFVSFLIGGGRRTDGTLEAQLLVGGEAVRTATGTESGALNWQYWDVDDLIGQTASFRILDQATGGWGHLTLDHVVMGPDPAQVRSDETTVNLVVDGEVVRSATGANSESLDWASWYVREFAGKTATILIVDNNRGGWGHILADHFMTSDTPVLTQLERYDWLDWGRDYYATVSFSNVPDNRRLMIGWMNNWDYAGDIPTGSWRGAMTLPREVTLTQTAKGPRLTQEVVDQIDSLRKHYAAFEQGPRDVAAGVETLPIEADVVQVDATFSPGSADSFGINVLSDGTSKTRIGYDVATSRLFVDRTNSGAIDFNPRFSSVDDAPVAQDADGDVTIRVYVDRSSVEVFAADGQVTITDQVFPNAGAKGLEVWSEGGTAHLESLKVTPLYGAMWDEQPVLSAPSNPLDVTATVSGVDEATVTWSPPAHDGGSAVTGYLVFESGSLDAPLCSTTEPSCVVDGLLPGSTHSFVVVAVNMVGESDASSASASITLPTAPSPPLDVAAIASSPEKAVVSWSAPADDGGSPVTGYLVFDSGDLDVPLCSTTQTSCVVEGLLPGSTHSFVVVAVNEVGESDASNASAPVTQPEAPTAADVTALEAILAQAAAVDRSLYTAASIADLDAAIAIANGVLGETDPSQEDVDAATAVVASAIDALVVDENGPPSAALSTTTVGPGGAVGITATGFEPGEEVEAWLHSTPVLLATLTASGAGTLDTTVTIPAGTAAGAHQLELRGESSGSVFMSLTVLPTLAASGASVGPALTVGACLLLLGSAFVGLQLARRGRRARKAQ